MSGLGKPCRQNSIKKIKNSKNRIENAACEQKTTTEKANFCSSIVFSLHLNKMKKFTPQNHSLLRSNVGTDLEKTQQDRS